MNPAIETMLNRYSISTPSEANRAVRELLQEICLLGIWRAKLFQRMAFYGGTALRILYGLDRFSEDLDFTLLQPDPHFNWNQFAKTIENELASYGFEVNIQQKKKLFTTSVQSAFLKTNTLTAMLSVGIPDTLVKSLHPDAVLRIKIEVDTDPVMGFETEQLSLRDPLPITITAVALPDLFASKMHAALFRAWKNRVKGRDWYDVIWYIRKRVPIRLEHFKQCLMKNKSVDFPELVTAKSLKEIIHKRIDTLDLKAVLLDIRTFIHSPDILDNWDKSFLHSWIDQLVVLD